MEEVQEQFENSNGIHFEGMDKDWYGTGNPTTGGSTSPYSNGRDYISFNYDKKEVEESKLAELPEYDFSGPQGTTPQEAESNLDTSLIAAESETTENTEVTTTANGKKVYLAPICCGLDDTGYLARTWKGYTRLKENSKKSSYSISDYKASLANMNSLTDKVNYGENRYKGYTSTVSHNSLYTVNYGEWRFCWDWAKRIGDNLKKNGCDVIYAYDATTCTNDNSDPKTFWGGKRGWTIQDIAEDIAKEDPDYVIWVGVNENGFKDTSKMNTSVQTGTIFMHGAGNGSKTFAKAINKYWSNVKDLESSLPRVGVAASNTYSGTVATAIGAQKAQTCLTALRINGYDKPSVAILFGNFKTNNSNKKAEYRYLRPNPLAIKLAEIIGLSM